MQYAEANNSGSRLEKLISGDEKQVVQRKHDTLSYRLVKKISKFVGSFLAVGAFDALHPRSLDIMFKNAGKWLAGTIPAGVQYYLPIPSQFYQFTVMSVDAALCAWSLYDKRWSKKRNLSSIVMMPVHAAGMDYSSAAIALGNPLALPLPSADYTWRIKAFKNTAWGGVAQWVDQPSRFIPGAIQGYDLAIYLTAGYVLLQAGFILYNYIKNKNLR